MTRTRGISVLAAVFVAANAGRGWCQPPPLPAITIQQAVSEALDHNLSLLAERYNVTVAQAAVVTAGLRPNPVLTLNVMRPDGPLVDAGVAVNDVVVRTDYVIERGGKRDRRIDQATLARTVAELQLLDATRKLVLDVQTAFTDLQLANAKIDYTISGEYHRMQGGGLVGNDYGIYFSTPLPIFNRNQGEVARAQSQQSQLETRTRALEADVTGDLDAAFTDYTSARRIVERIETSMLDQARDVRATMEYSYRRGEASLVELLDAVRAFNDTTRSYNEARADYAHSLYALDAISGKVTP